MPEQAKAAAAGSVCSCEKPLPVERALRKGVSRTECARCELPVPLRLR